MGGGGSNALSEWTEVIYTSTSTFCIWRVAAAVSEQCHAWGLPRGHAHRQCARPLMLPQQPCVRRRRRRGSTQSTFRAAQSRAVQTHSCSCGRAVPASSSTPRGSPQRYLMPGAAQAAARAHLRAQYSPQCGSESRLRSSCGLQASWGLPAELRSRHAEQWPPAARWLPRPGRGSTQPCLRRRRPWWLTSAACDVCVRRTQP